jgi:predicted metalloprotease with PDZ domain
VLHLFTDLHEDYHRATDDVSKLNVDGLKRVVDFTVGLATALADRPGPLTFVEAPSDPHGQPSMSASASSAAAGPGASSGGVGGGYGAYLGTIPDMTDTPGGVRLTGVRAGSPAERAGLRAEDVITRIGAMPVPDLQAMTNALRSHKPGDVVDIIVLRDGASLKVRATLGTRGG